MLLTPMLHVSDGCLCCVVHTHGGPYCGAAACAVRKAGWFPPPVATGPRVLKSAPPIMHASVGGWFQGCSRDKQRNNWRCAKTPPRRRCMPQTKPARLCTDGPQTVLQHCVACREVQGRPAGGYEGGGGEARQCHFKQRNNWRCAKTPQV